MQKLLIGLGKVILNAITKSKPQNLTGKTLGLNLMRFDLKNPHILSALPENVPLNNLSIFQGRRLTSVCQALDDPRVMERYNSILRASAKAGKSTKTQPLIPKATPPIPKATTISVKSKMNEIFATEIEAKAKQSTRPEIYNDLIKKSRNGEFSEFDLFYNTIDSKYKRCRNKNE